MLYYGAPSKSTGKSTLTGVIVVLAILATLRLMNTDQYAKVEKY